MTPTKSIKSTDAPTRADWRQWLADNHAIETSVWLMIFKKQSGTSSVTYDEAVAEALWV